MTETINRIPPVIAVTTVAKRTYVWMMDLTFFSNLFNEWSKLLDLLKRNTGVSINGV